MSGTVHIIGAGVAGLAAAVRLARGPHKLAVYESAPQAGGRCRSYYDSSLGMMIDNGNHLLLSGNRDALSFLSAIGSEGQLRGPPEAEFAFADFVSGDWWQLRPNPSPVPWWIFSSQRRVPGTNARDYLGLFRLVTSRRDLPLEIVLRRRGPAYERLWQPFFLAALNTPPALASSHLAAAIIRETLAKGGRACRPLIAAHGLSAAFVDPALAFLSERGVDVRFGHRLRAIAFDAGRASNLDFGAEKIRLAPADQVILAVAPFNAREIVPGLRAPENYHAIINAHYKIAPPGNLPPILGIINATIEWLFAFPDRLSVTISFADRLIDVPREELAAKIWEEVAEATKIDMPLPPWQIVKERRATFAATPAENARRPKTRTDFDNLLLAGDWTATGLPATIEGAIRSGHRAADEIAAN